METSANMAKQAPAPFGALLLHLRAAAGLTQEQLALRAGLSPNAISALESGKRRAPRFATVELLAAALALDEQQRRELVAAARSSAGGIESATVLKAAPTVSGVEPGAASAQDTWNTGRYDGASTDQRRQPCWALAATTPLVGRVQELETIVQSLVGEGARLLTLTGPAGVGKTRLALEAAARLTSAPEGSGRFPDGVVLVDLTPVRDPDLVPSAIARALGLLDVGGRHTLERVAEALGERSLMVALDNFEQVLSAATQLATLLATCPGLALLVTSRAPLQLRWERTLRVPPLPVPDLSTAPQPLDALLAIPAVTLFVERARARRADFAIGEREASLVAQLVAQLDGLPLALELAAARLDVLPLSALARRLEDRLQLLAVEAPDRPERQQSLEAAIGWSYDLLSEPEQRVFRCLGVFVGRVSLNAIAAVVGVVAAPMQPLKPPTADDERDTLMRLVSLAEKSLLLPARSDEEDGNAAKEDPEPTFGMLETVREYARERLATAGELTAACQAHAHSLLALAERADAQLRDPDQQAWFFRLERELDNLRAALRWLLDQAGRDDSGAAAEREAALRLAAALGYFWYLRGYHAEGRRWLEEALARAPRGAEREGEESAAWVDPAARTRALIAAGPLLMVEAQYARAQAVLQEALALAEWRQDVVASARASTYLGHAEVVAGNVEEGMRRLQEAVRRWEALGDAHGLGEALFYRGYAADVAGETAAAASDYMAALGWLAQAGNAQHAGFVHSYLGVLEGKRGNLSSAVAHLQAVLRTSVTLRDRWLLSFAAQATVVFVGLRAQPVEWARLLGAADALGQATGGATFGWEHLPGAEQVVRLRERLAREAELSAAYREGRVLPFATVTALALRLLEEIAAPASGAEAAPTAATHTRATAPGRHSPLTEREREVLRLVAQGLSSKAVGRQLFISERTVAQHVTAIFNKLGVNTRAQAAAVATQRGLL
jgi:predicted ATPase/DNA-binding CsgD family transcriptional regulator/transcriptional regulator with XRE-family HTH domain